MLPSRRGVVVEGSPCSQLPQNRTTITTTGQNVLRWEGIGEEGKRRQGKGGEGRRRERRGREREGKREEEKRRQGKGGKGRESKVGEGNQYTVKLNMISKKLKTEQK